MMQISDITDRPGFADSVADRGWHAWWTQTEVTLAQYRARLDEVFTSDGIPFALVAHDGDSYAGSVLVIENDLDARPACTPWIAALWVEPERRRQGIATQLLSSARTQAAGQGHRTLYLCANPDKTPLYRAQGFHLIETGVSGLNVFRG